MNRNPIATTTRSLRGACVGLRATDARMSHGAEQVSFGQASPGPGQGDASS